MEATNDRFWRQVYKVDGGCWLWTGATNRAGYGIFRLNRKNLYSHRWAYEATFGPLGPKQVIDHLCANPTCVHPYHLEAVSNRENILRGNLHRQTHCQQGHELTEANSKVNKTTGRRACRTCSNEGWKRRAKERWHAEPEYREKRLAQGRECYHRRRAGIQAQGQ